MGDVEGLGGLGGFQTRDKQQLEVCRLAKFTSNNRHGLGKPKHRAPKERQFNERS